MFTAFFLPPLERQLHEKWALVCFIHSCMLGAENRAWHIGAALWRVIE